MGNIVVGNKEIQGAWLGNVDVSAIWLGNVLVWPTDWYDCDDKLLVEREYGIKGPIHNKKGEFIVRIDRKMYQNERDYEDIITDGTSQTLQYEGPNNFPYDVHITRDYVEPSTEDTAYSLVTADTDDGEIAFAFEDPLHHSFLAYIGHDALPISKLPYITSNGNYIVNEEDTSYIISEDYAP